jgi:hypothetical protein
MTLRGTWRGTHTGHAAVLVIDRQNDEDGTFSGMLTVRMASGPVVLAVEGRLRDDGGTADLTFRETRVLRQPAPRSWDRGTNEGRLTGGGDLLSGSGRDDRGRAYRWRFERGR